MTRKVSNEGKICGSPGASLENKLRAYAVSAAAAGVGVLAVTQPADARIIFTPTRQTVMPNTTLKLDLNHDGINEFSLTIFNSHLGGAYQTGPNESKGRLSVAGSAPSNLAVKATSILSFVAALGSNAKIGGSDKFRTGTMAYCLVTNAGSPNYAGPWRNQKNKFLGLKFDLSGQTHYGWVRVSVKKTGTRFCEWEALVTGYAYESTPNTPILAGQRSGPSEAGKVAPDLDRPSMKAMPSLGLLAQGAPGLEIWRREEEAIA